MYIFSSKDAEQKSFREPLRGQQPEAGHLTQVQYSSQKQAISPRYSTAASSRPSHPGTVQELVAGHLIQVQYSS